MHFKYLLPALLIVLTSRPALAYTSIAGVHGGGKPTVITGALVLQDTEYETTDQLDIEGQVLTVGFKKLINEQLAIGAGAGFLLDGELRPRRSSFDDGSGFRLFFDADYEFKRFGPNQILGTFSLIHDSFEFEAPASGDIEFDINEAKIGALFMHRIQKFAVYGGLEIFLYSDGDFELVDKFEAERDSRLNLRLGGAFALDPAFDLRADLYLMSEQTLTLGVDFRI